MKIHFVQLNLPILQQLQLEEALLRADDRNWCLINQGSPPAIVMGISGKQELLVHPENPLPVIRRFSGGGTVVVDEDTLFVTWICNSADSGVEGFPDKILNWSEQLYKPLFRDYPFSLKENDYVFGERKFGGNAQYIRKDRWLHHSTLLWKYRNERMNMLLHPPKSPKYREQRIHQDFLCSLSEFYSCRNTLIENFKSVCLGQFDVENVSAKAAMEVLEKPHRKATTLIVSQSI